MTWAVAEAKAKFSEILDKAEAEGPQLVRRRKREFYVLTREQRDDLLTRTQAPKSRKSDKTSVKRGTLGDFFRNSSLVGSGLKIERVILHPRHVDF